MGEGSCKIVIVWFHCNYKGIFSSSHCCGVSALVVEMDIGLLKRISTPHTEMHNTKRSCSSWAMLFWGETELKHGAQSGAGCQLLGPGETSWRLSSSCFISQLHSFYSALTGTYPGSPKHTLFNTLWKSQLSDVCEDDQRLQNQCSSWFGSPSSRVVGRGCQSDLSGPIYFLHYAFFLSLFCVLSVPFMLSFVCLVQWLNLLFLKLVGISCRDPK